MNDDIKHMFLARLLKGDAVIPHTWHSVAYYEELIEEGLAAPVVNVSMWQKGYSITESGRQWLRDNLRKAL